MPYNSKNKTLAWVSILSSTAFFTGCAVALIAGGNLWPLTGIMTLPLGLILGSLAHFYFKKFPTSLEKQKKILVILVVGFIVVGFLSPKIAVLFEDKTTPRNYGIEAVVLNCRSPLEASDDIIADYEAFLDRLKKFQNGLVLPKSKSIREVAKRSEGVILDLEIKRSIFFMYQEKVEDKRVTIFDPWRKEESTKRFRLIKHKNQPAHCSDIEIGSLVYYVVSSIASHPTKEPFHNLPGVGIVSETYKNIPFTTILRESGQ